VIRNVVMGKLKDGATREEAERALAAIVALEPAGCLDMRVGLDAGLREGNWDFLITADFADVDAYRRYDLDEEHNRIRRELFAPIAQEINRIQIEA
jgi:Stress responsive A/B Barrel Domain